MQYHIHIYIYTYIHINIEVTQKAAYLHFLSQHIIATPRLTPSRPQSTILSEHLFAA